MDLNVSVLERHLCPKNSQTHKTVKPRKKEAGGNGEIAIFLQGGVRNPLKKTGVGGEGKEKRMAPLSDQPCLWKAGRGGKCWAVFLGGGGGGGGGFGTVSSLLVRGDCFLGASIMFGEDRSKGGPK